MNLNKDPESWARVSPAAVLDGSRAQAENVLAMAIEDIGRMAAQLNDLRRAHWLHGRLEAEANKPPSAWETAWPSKPIPPFHVSKTLMGFGGEDLNRITLHMPADQEFVLCAMGEPRTDVQRSRWNALAAKLSEIWKARP